MRRIGLLISLALYLTFGIGANANGGTSSAHIENFNLAKCERKICFSLAARTAQHSPAHDLFDLQTVTLKIGSQEFQAREGSFDLASGRITLRGLNNARGELLVDPANARALLFN